MYNLNLKTMRYSIEQDTGNIRTDSSIPKIGSKDNPKLITSKEYCKLPGTPEFIEDRVNHLGKYRMIFKSEGIYYKIINRL